MKVNKKLIILAIACICTILVGYKLSSMQASAEKYQEKIESNNIDSYMYGDDSQFEVVHKEIIGDGTKNGLTISFLVHKKTKVMYMHAVQFQPGYGFSSAGLEIMLDENGKPLLYENEE